MKCQGIQTRHFKILNQQLEAEVLASMYDQSLDQFATSNWQNVVFYNSIDVNTQNIESRNLTQSLSIDNFKTNRNYYVFYPSKPELNWFGFDFNYPKNCKGMKHSGGTGGIV